MLGAGSLRCIAASEAARTLQVPIMAVAPLHDESCQPEHCKARVGGILSSEAQRVAWVQARSLLLRVRGLSESFRIGAVFLVFSFGCLACSPTEIRCSQSKHPRTGSTLPCCLAWLVWCWAPENLSNLAVLSAMRVPKTPGYNPPESSPSRPSTINLKPLLEDQTTEVYHETRARSLNQKPFKEFSPEAL